MPINREEAEFEIYLQALRSAITHGETDAVEKAAEAVRGYRRVQKEEPHTPGAVTTADLAGADTTPRWPGLRDGAVTAAKLAGAEPPKAGWDEYSRVMAEEAWEDSAVMFAESAFQVVLERSLDPTKAAEAAEKALEWRREVKA